MCVPYQLFNIFCRIAGILTCTERRTSYLYSIGTSVHGSKTALQIACGREQLDGSFFFHSCKDNPFIAGLPRQYCLLPLKCAILAFINTSHMYINIRGSLMDLSHPRVMGIINVTDNSFYEVSRHKTPGSVLDTAALMLDQGADILDIGGCSTRPGSVPVDAATELDRIRMAVGAIRNNFPDAVISVDTFRAAVAQAAVTDFGADIVNDISAGEMDKDMFPLIERLNVPYILMHMQGTPFTMQKNPEYKDVVSDILVWFGEKIAELKRRGVRDIIIDPGFGFGKTAEQNFRLLAELDSFSITGLPVLAGLSRKTTIWKTLGITPDEALNGTTALNMAALMKGASILRVHDVKEAKETVTLFEKMYPSGFSFMHNC